MPSVSFFLIFTPQDVVLAPYTLRGLRNLKNLDFSWDVTVFLNGLSTDAEATFAGMVSDIANVTIKSNRARAAEWRPDFPLGELIKSDASGLQEMRYTPCETGAEVWTRELPLLPGTYACQVDGDFEILRHEFLQDMKRALDRDEKLCVVAMSRHDTHAYFDSYSNAQCVSAARADTWCAMWRRARIADPPGFYYREEKNADGAIVKYDHGAYLQHQLSQQGYRTAGVAEVSARASAATEGVHYGAFALNRTLEGERLSLYRFCRIAMFNGYLHQHGSERLAFYYTALGQRLYAEAGFAACDDERTRYSWQ